MSVQDNTSKVSKRKIAAVLGGAVVCAVVAASASTLGGASSASIGANSGDVTSPIQNGVKISWDTSYDAASSGYVISGVDLETVDSSESIPATAEVRLTLTDASGNSLGEYVSHDGGTDWASTPSTAIPAHDVEGASVVVNGGTVTAGVASQD